MNDSNPIVVDGVVGLWVKCKSELPDGRADALPSECVSLLNCVSTGVVSERADVLPFTCVAIETVRRSELCGRTSLIHRHREWPCLVAASFCRTSRRCSDVGSPAVGRVDRVLARDVIRSTPSVDPPSWSRFPGPGFTDGHRCRCQVVVRRSPGTSSPSPESRILHYSPLLTVSLFS